MKSKSLRKLIEMDAVSMNTPLRNTVKGMSWIILLRNCHPLHREGYARELYRESILTRDEAREFTSII